MFEILDDIDCPDDIKKLNNSQLNTLSKEIRELIIKVVSENGGHLASNLGIVELTIALHRVFDSPRDKIIWDVGHQSYVHKILTGRRDVFNTIRKYGGISGFPKKCESIHDIFETGHSSNSISVALGIAKARDLSGDDYSVIAVIGDGALTGGMSFEALNHAGEFPTNLIVILNDNAMSISPNVGSLRNYLYKLRTDPTYFKLKEDIEVLLNRIPIIGKHLFKASEKFRDWLKYLIVPGIMFEEFGFKYLGPIDGHDIENLEVLLKRAKTYNGHPTLIHVVTKKGKGYDKAEKLPHKFHGISPFVVETGEVKSKSNSRNFSNIFGEKLAKLAESNSKILAVTAAMPDGTGLTKFAYLYHDRFFDVGIAEQHAVTFCAGLAIGGYKPVFAVYSTFLQRAYDQILEDVCMQNLPVVFAIDRAGIVGNDGETHHGVFDISFLRHMPNLVVISPRDGKELECMLEFALSYEGPIAIRYPRGKEYLFETGREEFQFGKSEVLTNGKDAVIIAEGKMVSLAYEVYRKLASKGKNIMVINTRFIKPLDTDLLLDIVEKYKIIYTLEDNVILGGLGSSILEFYSYNNIKSNVKILAYEDRFITHGDVDELYKLKSMDIDSISKKILKELEGI